MKIGDAWWLTADFSVKCWEGSHAQSVILMGVCTTVYVVGVPIACALVLWRNRRLMLDRELRASPAGKTFRQDYGSLFRCYDGAYWYFESVEMLKKMTLAGGLVLVAPGSSVQVLVGILVAFCFFAIVLQYKPYADATDNKLQAFATAQIMLTLLMGAFLKMDVTGEYQQALMGGLLLCMNISVVVLGLLSIALIVRSLRWRKKEPRASTANGKVAPISNAAEMKTRAKDA